MKKLLIITTSLILVCCNNQQGKEESSLRLEIQKKRKLIDSLHKSLKEQKNHSAYWNEYRCFFSSQTGNLVYGEEGDMNSIYEIEAGHGMGFMSYIYFSKDIDDHPLVLSALYFNWNDIDYTIKDKDENEIEHYTMDSNKTAKMNGEEFEIKQNQIFEEAKRKTLQIAISTKKS